MAAHVQPHLAIAPNDISVVLPGNFKMKILSRAPLEARVATLGVFHTEFTAENKKFNAYIGFGEKPMDMSPYLRFIAVKAVSLTDSYKPEGMYIEGDPFTGASPGSGRKAESYISRFARDDVVVVAKECYNVISGIYKLIHDMKLLDGEKFETLMRVSEVLSSHIGRTLLGSFVKDPMCGADTVFDMLREHVYVEPLVLSMNPTPDGGFRLFFHGRVGAGGRPQPRSLYFIRDNPLLIGEEDLQRKLEDCRSDYPLGTVFNIEPGIVAVTTANLQDDNMSPELLELAPSQAFEESARVSLDDCAMHIRMAPDDPGGIILNVNHIRKCVVGLVGPIDEDDPL